VRMALFFGRTREGHVGAGLRPALQATRTHLPAGPFPSMRWFVAIPLDHAQATAQASGVGRSRKEKKPRRPSMLSHVLRPSKHRPKAVSKHAGSMSRERWALR